MHDQVESPSTPTRRARRSPEQLIADLQRQVTELKARAERVVVLVPRNAPDQARVVPQSPRPSPVAGPLDNSLDAKIHNCIQLFSAELVALIKRAALEATASAFSAHMSIAGSATDNEPPFELVLPSQGLMPTKLRRAAWRRESMLGSPSAEREAEPLKFEHYERMAIERALAECGGNAVAAGRLLQKSKSAIYRRIRVLEIRPSTAGTFAVSPHDPLIGTDAPLSLGAYERAAILRALKQSSRDVTAASKLLKTGKSTLYRRMEALGIPRAVRAPTAS